MHLRLWPHHPHGVSLQVASRPDVVCVSVSGPALPPPVPVRRRWTCSGPSRRCPPCLGWCQGVVAGRRHCSRFESLHHLFVVKDYLSICVGFWQHTSAQLSSTQLSSLLYKLLVTHFIPDGRRQAGRGPRNMFSLCTDMQLPTYTNNWRNKNWGRPLKAECQSPEANRREIPSFNSSSNFFDDQINVIFSP